MVEISKRDWKWFRERVPDWQERYMEQLIKEYYRNIKCAWKCVRSFLGA